MTCARRVVAAARPRGPDAGAREPLATMLAGLVSRLPDLAVSAAPGGRFEVHHAAADKRAAVAALCERLGCRRAPSWPAATAPSTPA